jgi:hypothetical protein
MRSSFTPATLTGTVASHSVGRGTDMVKKYTDIPVRKQGQVKQAFYSVSVFYAVMTSPLQAILTVSQLHCTKTQRIMESMQSDSSNS